MFKKFRFAFLVLTVAAFTVSLAVIPTQSAAAAPSYSFINKMSGKCLDVAGGPTATQNGANIQQWTCLNKPNQRFYLQGPLSDNTYKVIAVHSNKCLSALSTSIGTEIIQYSCLSGPPSTQRWYVQNAGSLTSWMLTLKDSRGGRMNVRNTNNGTHVTVDAVNSSSSTWSRNRV